MIMNIVTWKKNFTVLDFNEAVFNPTLFYINTDYFKPTYDLLRETQGPLSPANTGPSQAIAGISQVNTGPS